MSGGAARRAVAVIGGGAGSEHEVSLASAAAIAAALDRARYDVVELTIGRDGSWAAAGRPLADDLLGAVRILERVDVVIPALHGPHGEDGTVAGLLDLIGVPYVGAGVVAGALAMDKAATKRLAASLGIGVAEGIEVMSADDARLADLVLPVVVKPSHAGSSHGVSLARTRSDLVDAVRTALGFDRVVLVERVVTGREIDLAVLEQPDGTLRCGPALEIGRDASLIFDTSAKYEREPDFRIPAPLTGDELAALQQAALAMFRALRCAGLARVDFFLTAEGPVLNEVNTFPGFTERSQVPRMFAAEGLGYAALLDVLIDTAIVRHEGYRVRRLAVAAG